MVRTKNGTKKVRAFVFWISLRSLHTRRRIFSGGTRKMIAVYPIAT
ncbi:hypothetical protein FTUN_3143 [Frigoriglobus tundricola]|uniref:Uncharacterized protein n=1 Tax=Frigoriglobus tundricola TaxID=2774151 RepID=A0A6M5YQL2_9BACT|nr:hypothetical protein FTUN_3143 [Frigoriglobus tundricola]